jgi:soluble lytic murein transglycosylase-like protein
VDFTAVRKEGNVMVYLEEPSPKKNYIKNSISCVFALSLGLSISIADVKLPAETRADRGKLPHLLAGDPAFTGDAFADSNEAEISEPSTSVYVPTAEPEPLPYDRLIHEAAGLYGVDVDLIQAIIMAESQFNPRAISKRGAKGLMQLMPVTADAFDVANIYNPEENVKAGVRHFRWLLDLFDGDLKLALAAYNAGPQKVLRYDGIPPYPETRAYVTRVMEYYAAIKEDTFEF